MPAIRPGLRIRPSRKGVQRLRARRGAPDDRLSDLPPIRDNPGNLAGRCLRAGGAGGPGASGRRAARLHPGRRGLRSRLGLVAARRQTWLHPALPRAEPRQQSDALLQLVLGQRQSARHGRGGVDRGDGRGDEEGARRSIPKRIFVTGLSAGGAMAAVMLATYPELFAGGAIIAGVAYGCASGVAEAFDCMGGRARERRRRARRARPPRLAAQGAVAARPGLAGQRRHDRRAGQCRCDRAAMGAPARPRCRSRTGSTRSTAIRAASGRARTAAPLIEQYTITGMAHGIPLDPGTGEGESGAAGAHMLDVGLSSTDRIAAFFGIAPAVRERVERRDAARPAASRARANAAGTGVGRPGDDRKGAEGGGADALRPICYRRTAGAAKEGRDDGLERRGRHHALHGGGQ